MTRAHRKLQWAMSKDATSFKLSVRSKQLSRSSRNYARVPGYKEKYKKMTRKRREKKWKMNGVEINTRAYVATRLLLRWDYLYAVTLKTKVFGDYNHARLVVSWITSTVWEIPRSRYRHVTGRRRMSAVVLHAVSRNFDLVIHLAQCGLDNQSAGVARRIFFLLRHLSKFPSFKKENPSCRSEIWPWEVSLLHLKREVCLRTLAWYGQVWCFSDESPNFHGRRNKFRGCPFTRVHQSRMTEQFTRA